MLLKKFLNLQESLTGTLSGLTYKTYNNTMVRAGKPITNPKRHAIGYMTYFKKKMQEQIDKMKSPAGKRNTKQFKENMTESLKNM